MRKKEFRISSGLKLVVLTTLLTTLYACQTVYTANPLPSAESPEATTLPRLLAGDFLIMDDEDMGSDNEPGKQYVRITQINNQHCLLETYFGFDMEELAAHPHSERFRVEGDYLIYKNDSLILELAEAEERVEASPENQEYKKGLKTLRNMAENGHLNHVTPITKRGHLMIYNREPILEIDLAEKKSLSYDGQNLVEAFTPSIKYHNGRLFINHPNSDHGWETIILDLTDDAIMASDISFKHMLKNKARYEKTANLNQPGKDAFIINPSVPELDKMLEEEGFLKNQVTLKRVVLEEEAQGKPSWLLIAMGAIVLVILLRAMRRPQVQS